MGGKNTYLTRLANDDDDRAIRNIFSLNQVIYYDYVCCMHARAHTFNAQFNHFKRAMEI